MTIREKPIRQTLRKQLLKAVFLKTFLKFWNKPLGPSTLKVKALEFFGDGGHDVFKGTTLLDTGKKTTP